LLLLDLLVKLFNVDGRELGGILVLIGSDDLFNLVASYLVVDGFKILQLFS